MFDFIRNLAKSAEEKRLETLNAYADGELSARERRQFEAELAENAALRAELAQLRQVKDGVRQLPRARAPRNFTLDPAVYGRPQPQPAYELYPALRVATAVAAFFFIIAVVLDLATPAGGLGQPLAAVSHEEAPAAEVGVAQEAADAAPAEVTPEAEEIIVESEAVEVTRVVTETVEEEEMAAAAEEEAPEALEAAPAEEPVEEEALEREEAVEEAATSEVAEAPAERDDDTEVLTAPEEDEADGEEAPAMAAPAVAITATATATETARTEALPPPTITSVPPAAQDLPADEPVDGGLPILLVAEIVLGVGLVVLLTVTLLIRRNL